MPDHLELSILTNGDFDKLRQAIDSSIKNYMSGKDMSGKELKPMEQKSNEHLAIWDDKNKLSEIRSVCAKNSSDEEFKTLVAIGLATGLNPFLKELWCVKYDKNKPAQIFIGRDGYRKTAQRQKEYDYHQADAIFSNDIFEINDGRVHHVYNLKDRGKLVGAYGIAKRKSASAYSFVYVDLKEYIKPFGVWSEKAATMIKKVAEAQVLRMVYQEIFAGTYDTSEAWFELDDDKTIENDPSANKRKSTSQSHEMKTIFNIENPEHIKKLKLCIFNHPKNIYKSKDDKENLVGIFENVKDLMNNSGCVLEETESIIDNYFSKGEKS